MHDIFLSVFVYTPLCDFLCNPKRKWNIRYKYSGRCVAMAILTTVVIFQALKKDKNFYEHFGVTPHDSVDVIKRAFKSVAIEMHPDRNSSTNANEYSRLVARYKIITKMPSRDLYNRYGDILTGDDANYDEINQSEVLYVVGIRTFSSMIVTLFLAMCSTSNSAYYESSLMYEAFCFFFDIYLRFAPEGADFLGWVPILRGYTIFEIIEFIRHLRMLFLYCTSVLMPPAQLKPETLLDTITKKQTKILSWFDDYIRQLKRVFGADIISRAISATSSGNGAACTNRVDYTPLFKAAIAKATGGHEN